MARRGSDRREAVGVALVLGSAAAGFVLFWQPWVGACEFEDSSAGCPAPAHLVPWMNAGWGVVLVAVVVGVVLLRRATRSYR